MGLLQANNVEIWFDHERVSWNPKWNPMYIMGTWHDPDDLRLQDAYMLIIFKWLYQDAESYNPEF